MFSLEWTAIGPTLPVDLHASGGLTYKPTLTACSSASGAEDIITAQYS